MRYLNFVKTCSFILFLLIGISSLRAQIKLELLTKFDAKGELLETDVLGNVYLLDGDGIRKYDLRGKKLLEAGTIAFGNRIDIDATDPLKLLAYYKDYNQVVVLDNKLAERGNPILLDEMGIVSGEAICRSYNNAIWLFDQINFEVIRLDEQLSIVNRSGNLQQLIGYVPQPVFMQETARNLYLCDPNTGILVFDLFGNYYKTIPIKGVEKVAFRNNLMFYKLNNQLIAYDLILLAESEVLIDLTDAIDFSIYEDKLIILQSEGVYIYSVKVQ